MKGNPVVSEKRRQQNREAKRRQREREASKTVEFSIKLNAREISILENICKDSEFTRTSVIKDLIYEAQRRIAQYQLSYDDKELILGNPEYLDNYYQKVTTPSPVHKEVKEIEEPVVEAEENDFYLEIAFKTFINMLYTKSNKELCEFLDERGIALIEFFECTGYWYERL